MKFWKRLCRLLLSLLLLLSLCGCELLADLAETALDEANHLLEHANYYDETVPPAPSDLPASEPPLADAERPLPSEGSYDTPEEVVRYLRSYGCLPDNYITKAEARSLGWEGGALEPFAPGKCIGGDRFGNYEGLLPEADGRVYYECDIGTLGAAKRGAKRLVFSNDGLFYYTEDHYESFRELDGAP